MVKRPKDIIRWAAYGGLFVLAIVILVWCVVFSAQEMRRRVGMELKVEGLVSAANDLNRAVREIQNVLVLKGLIIIDKE